MFTKVKLLAFIFLILTIVLGNVFAINLVHDASKLSIEKSAVEHESVKAWEVAAKHNDALRLNIDFLTNLSHHIDNYPKLDLDIDNPVLFNAYKKIHDNPELGFETLKELGDDVTEQIQDLAKSEFFKHFVVKGRQFNKNIVDNFLSNNVIKNKLQQLFPGINLDEYQLLTEVQLYTPGGFTKADILLVKKTGNSIDDVIYIENKLSKSTALPSSAS